MTGCQFAARIARERHRILSFVVSTMADEADVSGFFDTCREARLPGIAIFTGIRTEAALIEQLARLREGERWRIAECRRTASTPTTYSSAWTGESARVWCHP